MRSKRKTPVAREPGPQKQMVQAIERAIFRKYLIDQSGWGVLREVSIDDLAAQEAHRASAGIRSSQPLRARQRRAMAVPAG